VVGYEVYHGTESEKYQSVFSSTTNSVTVPNLGPGEHYFAVKAHGSDRTLDSDFSEEVSTSIPYPPAAAFRADVTGGIAPLVVTFEDASSGSIDAWQWDFGDGNTSAEPSPTHTFMQPGDYSVVLTVTGPGGSSSTAGSGTIAVHALPPVADFTESVTSGVAPLAVLFRDSSSGGQVESCTWSFGDGGSARGSDVAWTYTKPGTYTVSMTATGAGGSSTRTKEHHIKVDGLPPTADFTADYRAGMAPLQVSFQNLSRGDITSFDWDFGDGARSSDANPIHHYTKSGTYDVKLTATGPYGSDTAQQVAYINVGSKNLVVEAGELLVDHTWQWVAFEQEFTDPVVVANPPSFNGSQPAVVRIDGVTADGFWIRVQEWDYLDGYHAPETVSFVAMERGRHQLPDGEWVEAGQLAASGQGIWDRIGFAAAFDTAPVVLTSVASESDPRAVTTRVNQVTTSTFDIQLQQQESIKNGHGSETVTYIAWEPSEGIVNGVQFNVGTTGNVVDHTPYALTFDVAFQDAPLLLASMQTSRGGDTAGLRWTNPTAAGIDIWVEEEASQDSEVTHAREAIGWAVFE
jgi:surface-anchored protein